MVNVRRSLLVVVPMILGVLGPVQAGVSSGSTTPAPAEGPAARYAPIDRPGPDLRVPRDLLRSSVTCTPSARTATQQVVLIVPATGVGPRDYAWNWQAALKSLGRPFCTVSPPESSVGDIQRSAEYVVHAIRHAARISGRRIAVLGHSQGGVTARFALRFWPGTRAQVDDYIGLAPPNHGAIANDRNFRDGGPASLLQLKRAARLIDAVNSRRETFEGISYTVLSTERDQFVGPQGTTDLRGPSDRVANVLLQEVCPSNESDHITVGTSDPLAFALVMNALRRRGPADPSSLSSSDCERSRMPGVDQQRLAVDIEQFIAHSTESLSAARVRDEEPPLRRFVYDQP